MKTKTDISYGIIPIRKTAQGIEVLLIHQYSKIKDYAYWTFPKGHAEGNESPRETALREMQEETGLEVQEFIAEQTFSIQYNFTWQGTHVDKTATFFLATVDRGEVQKQVAEVRDFVWLPIDQVEEKLDYDISQEMFRDVLHYLETTNISHA